MSTITKAAFVALIEGRETAGGFPAQCAGRPILLLSRGDGLGGFLGRLLLTEEGGESLAHASGRRIVRKPAQECLVFRACVRELPITLPRDP